MRVGSFAELSQLVVVIVLGIGVKFFTEPGREVVTEHEWALGY